MCIIDHEGKEHNICDVGFGCSQVMPVLTAGLYALTTRSISEVPIYVVQEPEIHLHPNAQAALGSFFVGLANQGMQIFIETHSDHLVLRLARHVARHDIEASDVSIYFVEVTKDQRVVTSLKFASDGTFEPDWPGGFFPQRKTESLAIARDRLQSNDSNPDQLNFQYL